MSVFINFNDIPLEIQDEILSFCEYSCRGVNKRFNTYLDLKELNRETPIMIDKKSIIKIVENILDDDIIEDEPFLKFCVENNSNYIPITEVICLKIIERKIYIEW